MNAETSRKFRLSLLGRFELTGPQGVVELPSRKFAALLAYLACTGPRPQSREKLCTLLWGSHFDTQARQNLRQALSRLRKMLGQGALQSDAEMVSLNSAVIPCDVGRFEALIREGSRDSLSAAANLYRGRLVDDVAVVEDAWSEWLAGERERLLDLALGALIGLGEQELVAARAEHALRAGRRAVALDNLREDAHRLIVQALAATGRKAEALRHYQDLVALLKRELNTEPDAATTSLAAELRTMPPSRGPSAIETVKPATAGRETAVMLESERRQLTIVSCKMVNATSLSALLDPEDMRDLIASFYKTVADVVARFDGLVAQHLNDSALVYFGYPAAREHDTEQAVRCGLALCDAVATDMGLPARVGIATGLVVIEQLGIGDAGQRTAIGETPDLAALLQAAAAPGEVVIAAGTHRLVGRMFDCLALDGGEDDAWRVRGEVVGVSRFEARRSGSALPPLVGRFEETDLLLRRWDQARRGEGRVVLLSGEAGIGKSCVAENLLVRLDDGPHACLRYFGSPHHGESALYPFIVQLEHAAAFEAGSTVEAKLDKLKALLSPAAKNMARDVALVAELLGLPVTGRDPALALDPSLKREMTLEALLDQVEGVAARSPVLIVCEDIHWIDPTSQDLLERAVARIAGLPVLMVLTARPDIQPAWAGQPHVTSLSLNRLGRRDSARLIDGVVGEKTLPEAVVEQIVSHADGVPLFLEELTRTLLDSGLLRETADRYVLGRPLPPLAIPTTLQASLVARLDRLGSGKNVAMIGAAIGREFSHELIVAVSALDPADLDAGLERLTASRLVSRRGAPPDATYAFKHALVQEAAYATILKSRRRELHGRIAQALVARFPAMAESEPELVARHFTEGGLASEAIGYWLKASHRAVARSAHREAVMSIDQALHLLKAQPETRETLQQAIDLRFALKYSLIPLGEFERILPHLQEAERIARRLDDRRRLGRVHTHICHAYWISGQAAKALASGEEARAVAQALGDGWLEMRACLQMGGACVFSGDYRRGEQLLAPLLQHPDAFGATPDAVQLQVAIHAYLSVIFEGQGKFQQGIEHGEEGMRLAETRNNPHILANVTLNSAVLAIGQGDFARAILLAQRAQALCRQWNLAMMSASAKGNLGQAYAQSGRSDEGIPMLEEAVAAMATMRHGGAVALFQFYLGQAYLAAHQVENALASAERALAVARESGQRGIEARVLCLLGDIAIDQDLPDRAEVHFQSALKLATECGSRPFVAHCHFGLGKLYRRTGSCHQADEHLAAATAMYREMQMPHWLKQAEVERR